MADLRRCQLPYELREYDPGQDEGIVYRSYLSSFWKLGLRQSPVHGAASQELRWDVYAAGQREILNGLLGNHAQVVVACSPEDRWQVLGFMIVDDLPSGFVLHYLYVKRMFRRAGLGAEMVKTRLNGRRKLVFTHFTAPWKGLRHSLRQRGVFSVYNPYLGR